MIYNLLKIGKNPSTEGGNHIKETRISTCWQKLNFKAQILGWKMDFEITRKWLLFILYLKCTWLFVFSIYRLHNCRFANNVTTFANMQVFAHIVFSFRLIFGLWLHIQNSISFIKIAKCVNIIPQISVHKKRK